MTMCFVSETSAGVGNYRSPFQMTAVSALSQTLRRYTSLNHLAQVSSCAAILESVWRC